MIFSSSTILSILSVTIFQVKSYDFNQDNFVNLAKFISNGKPCLGVLLEHDIVLTSGSCAEGIKPGEIVTLKNKTPRGGKLPSYKVIAAIAHPKYARWLKNDKPKRNGLKPGPVGAKDFDLGIILINLKNKLSPLLPIELNSNKELAKVGKYVMAIVWHPEDNHQISLGLSDYTDYDQKQILKQGECHMYGSTMKSNVTFCIGHPTDKEGLVEHELGAPIISYDKKKVTLLGIYSEGRYNGQAEAPSKITKISGFIRWIKKVTEDREFFTKEAANLIGDRYEVEGLTEHSDDAFANTDKNGMLELDIDEQRHYH